MTGALRNLIALAAIASAVPAWAQQGAMVAPRNLEQLTDRAATIVRGNVAGAHIEKHPRFQGLHTVVVTLQVRETLKGPAQRTFTFRQYVWDIRGRMGYTDYRKGDDLLLLMIAPNEHGLSSPAGMDQGRFRISRDAVGREVAVNGHGNARLFDRMTAANVKGAATLSAASRAMLAEHRAGPVDAAALTGLIREMVRAGD